MEFHPLFDSGVHPFHFRKALTLVNVPYSLLLILGDARGELVG